MATSEARAAAAEARVRDHLARLAGTSLPIVAGPWTGEVGFELLYWIPFVRWAVHEHGLAPERLIAVSRGGVASWYGGITSQYADAFDAVTPAEFHAATQFKKQLRVGQFDRRLARHAMRERRLRRAHLLPPAVMYAIYKALWRVDPTAARFEGFARFARVAPDDRLAAGLDLPGDFVAVRFYFSASFPDTPDNRAFASRAVADLAADRDVVLLNNDLVVDDHRDFLPGSHGRVHRLAARMQPATNLAVQTAVIARARAFVGTYGGYSYLAPLCGVPSVAYYSAPAFKRHHLELAHRVFASLGDAALSPRDVAGGELPRRVLAGLPAAVAR